MIMTTSLSCEILSCTHEPSALGLGILLSVYRPRCPHFSGLGNVAFDESTEQNQACSKYIFLK